MREGGDLALAAPQGTDTPMFTSLPLSFLNEWPGLLKLILII